jgi:thiamine biosynthesis lipoprotein
MQQQWLQMGMPISLWLNGNGAKEADIAAVQEWFALVDDLFSTYKPTSQISLINSGQLHRDQADQRVQLVLDLCEQTKRETEGYFSIETPVGIDPSGLVKGWAIEQAAT